MKSLTYVEIDVDRCSNVYGSAPCAAVTQAANDATQYWDFDKGDTNSFAATNGTLVGGVGGATLTETATDLQLRTPSLLTIDGSKYQVIVIDWERVTADTTFDGIVFYTTAGHGESGSFFKTFSNISAGNRGLTVLDMASLNAGGTDWITNTITRLRFDFGQTGTGVIKIHSIRVCARGSGFKCYNSPKTCQDRLHLTPQTETIRFSLASEHYPDNIDAIPNMTSIAFSPGTISLGEDLGQRATFTAQFLDHPHSDTGPGGDRYRTTRGFDPWKQGTWWGKFRARFPYLTGRPLRVYRGYLGQQLSEMDIRYYVIDSFDGPTPNGVFTIVAKDVLKLADDDKSQAPKISNGFLSVDILDTDKTTILQPTGVMATYPDGGYANVGGSEIVRYGRAPYIDAKTAMLLHGNGSNGGTTITDSGPAGRTVSRTGATTSTTQAKFGSASINFSGSGQYLQLDGNAAFAFGNGDFTVSMWYRPNSNGDTQVLYDSRPAGSTGAYLLIFRNASNNMVVNVNGADQITSVYAAMTGAWHHVAVTRKNGVTRLFLQGGLAGSFADTTNYLNGASRPSLGASGNNLANSNLNGYLDEIHVIKGEALWSTSFAPPQDETTGTSSDTVSMIRAQYSTLAVAHSSQDRFQWCLQYSAASPADILYDLLVNYANVNPNFINLSTWQNEISNYLQRSYTALIPNPTGVNKLASELIQQAALAMWWDDSQQKIALSVLRQIPTNATLLNEDNINSGSITTKEQPELRISQVWTYYALINPLVDITQTSNYRSVELAIAAQVESDYGQAAIKQIFSRWIPQFGRSIATKLNQLILGRYQSPPRMISFEGFGPSSNFLTLGGGFNLQFRTLTDEQGNAVTVPIQVTRLNPGADKYQIEAQEALFAGQSQADFNNRVIVIDTSTNNFNLKTVHDQLFPPIIDPTGITVTCVIQQGVIVGSSKNNAGSTTPKIAFDVGAFPAGTDITLVLLGDIRAGGGNGGWYNRPMVKGGPGGTALKTTRPLKIRCDDNTRKIAGGGGGGAGGVLAANTGVRYGAGGGAGQLPGSHQASSGGFLGVESQDGTLTAGGLGAKFGGNYRSGAGGAPGQAGGSGDDLSGNITYGDPGDAGKSIDGIANITYINLTPTLIGPTV